jgi:hypothetical protein
MKNAIIACGAGLLFSTAALAQVHGEHAKKETPATPTAAIEATVTGQNVCLGCTLKEERGAASRCDKYGHRHALKVTSATANGDNLAYMQGWFLVYLDTDAAQPFIREHDGETLTLKGKVYADARVLEVEKQVEAGKDHPKKSEHPEHPKG